ncbi:MAG: thioredoxin-disulfide reductase [Muribaculaceae bacterium]|nr:thioredoxin-disulfide reductase [Muribaculaceae bacterium]
MENTKTKVLIIGSGPAGYTAALYASRANLNPVVYEGHQPGGQLTQTTEIENFPGYPEGVQGTEMMEHFRRQALRFGTDIRSRIITKVDFSKRPFVCTDEKGEVIEAESVIISTGATARYLGLPDEEKYRGLGVSACATCDGFFYKNRNVAVVGGGDTACEEALYLASLAHKVYLIVRRDVLRASKVMQERVRENPKIEILFNCNTEGLFGNDLLEGAHIIRHRGTEKEERFDIDIEGFFLAIGHNPNTEIFREYIDCDSEGYIKVKGNTSHTNIEGVFAAGDCCDPRYRQAVVAAGSGCKAAMDAEKFLVENG